MTEDLPGKILHIDDDPLLRDLVAAIFDGIDGFDCKSAADGSQALTILKDFRPELILLDLSMPEVDGPEFLKTMRTHEEVNGTPVIIITQFNNINMQGQYDRLGVIGIIHKPIDPHGFLGEIRDIWQSR